VVEVCIFEISCPRLFVSWWTGPDLIIYLHWNPSGNISHLQQEGISF
jgi:hypothetical protein